MKDGEIVDSSLESNGKYENPPSYIHTEKIKTAGLSDAEGTQNRLNAVFENPLAGIPRQQLFQEVEEFCREFNLMDDVEVFKKGALVSQNPESATSLPELDEFEREALIREHTHKWHQPWQLYFLASQLPNCGFLYILTPNSLTVVLLTSYVFSCCRSTGDGWNGQ